MDSSKEIAKYVENSSKSHQTHRRQPIKTKHKQLLENLMTILTDCTNHTTFPPPRIATTRKLATTSIPVKPYMKTKQDTETPEHYNSK